LLSLPAYNFLPLFNQLTGTRCRGLKAAPKCLISGGGSKWATSSGLKAAIDCGSGIPRSCVQIQARRLFNHRINADFGLGPGRPGEKKCQRRPTRARGWPGQPWHKRQVTVVPPGLSSRVGSNRVWQGGRKSSPSHLESRSNSENTITTLFSSTYWEVQFNPCVFSKLLGGSFILNIFFIFPFISNDLLGAISIFSIFLRRVIVPPQGGAGGTCAGGAVLRGAFISFLAYTYWLEMSSRQTVIRRLRAVSRTPQ
jgi:hypothetical protein